MKKIFRSALGIAMSAAMLTSMSAFASAADRSDAVIDQSAKGSITVHKYDTTTAEKTPDKGGMNWTADMFLSDGKAKPNVESQMANYAIEGVEFTAIKVGNINTYTVQNGQTNDIQVIYGIQSSRLLAALDMDNYGIDAVTNIGGINYYTSDDVQKALSGQLASNNRATKDTLEAIVAGADNKVFPLTDANGKASINNLDVGVYLVVETKTPENVTSTVDPFLVSVPMTDSYEADGSGNVVHGDNWFYDIDVYPKNQTGMPTLEKEVSDTAHGLAFGTADLGYNDVATASDGDALTYRLISDMPTISSTATYLTQYKFDDVMSKGVKYNKNDIKICWYDTHDTAIADYTAATAATPTAVNGANADATWNYGSDFFTVTYGTNASGQETMTVKLTAEGLKEVNKPVNASDQHGKYSDCTMVIYYGATVHSDADVVYGDKGNPNDVKLTWSRISNPEQFFDTLKDRSIVYVYGIDLTKKFSDGGTKFDNVEFLLENISNVTTPSGKNMYVVATETAGSGVAHSGKYFVTGYTENEAEATHFIPNSGSGKLLVYGLEEDTYKMTEVQTASGYNLLKDHIILDLDTTYTEGTPQEKGLKCGKLVAKATVDGTSVPMAAEGDSANALIPLSVLNTRGPDLPKTGGEGTLLTTVSGIAIAGVLAGVVVISSRKGKSDEAAG